MATTVFTSALVSSACPTGCTLLLQAQYIEWYYDLRAPYLATKFQSPERPLVCRTDIFDSYYRPDVTTQTAVKTPPLDTTYVLLDGCRPALVFSDSRLRGTDGMPYTAYEAALNRMTETSLVDDTDTTVVLLKRQKKWRMLALEYLMMYIVSAEQ